MTVSSATVEKVIKALNKEIKKREYIEDAIKNLDEYINTECTYSNSSSNCCYRCLKYYPSSRKCCDSYKCHDKNTSEIYEVTRSELITWRQALQTARNIIIDMCRKI